MNEPQNESQSGKGTALPPADAAALEQEDRDEAHPRAEHLRDEMKRITDRLSQLVGRLTHSEGRYQALLDNANDAIAVLDKDGIVLDVNRALTRLVGQPAAELCGKHFGEGATALLTGDTAADFREMLASGRSRETVVSIRAADGQLHLIEFSAAVVDVDHETLVLALGRDVTERERTRAALAASEARLQSLLTHLPIAVWAMNAGGTITYVSPGVERITGFTADELLRRLSDDREFWASRIDRDDFSRVDGERRRFLRRETATLDCEYRWQTRSGQWIWLHDRARWRVEPEGQRLCDGIFDDVTARHVLEDSLRQAQKLEAVGQLAGGVAHDFNNLLTIIMANAHFLIEELQQDDGAKSEAEEILQAALRGAALTRQLLLYSRKEVIQPERVSVGASVQQLCKMLDRLIGEDIELNVAAQTDSGDVFIDPAQLEQVVLNLAVNGRDAMPAGGRLDIEVQRATIPPAGLPTSTGVLLGGDYVKLVVRDCGCGIAPDVQQRIFEPFFTTKAPGHGTGLGLSTVHAIVTDTRGGVALESTVGCGTTFSVYFPRMAGAEPLCAGSASSKEMEPAGDETILLVEDEDQVASVATRILESAGYRVLPAVTADAAVGILARESQPVDLLLTDVVMPSTNGPELVTQMRAIRPALPVLYVSGYSQHAALGRQVASITPLLRKPFTSSELLREVRAVLDRAHAERPGRGDAAPAQGR